MSERKKGSTSVSLLFRLVDSATGAAKAGIDVTTLKLQYERPGEAPSTATSLTLLAALTTAFTEYGAKEVDATNSKGVYRVDCPDAGFAAGADEVAFTVTGTGIEPSTRLIDLTTFDSRDVNGNLQGLNGTTAPTAGPLLTKGTGTAQLDVAGGKAPATVAAGDGVDAATLVSRITAARAGYLDNLNVGGPVASQADVDAINVSATKHLLLASVQQFERPESSSTGFDIECRTFDATTGDPVDADSTPTLTATGKTSGDLSANLSAATHVATGVYRWTYSVASGATIEQIRFDVAATIATIARELSYFAQVVDEVAKTWTQTNNDQLTALFNAIPAGGFADETAVLAAIAGCQQTNEPVTLPDNPPAGFLVAASLDATAVTAIQAGLATAAALLVVQHSVEADRVIDTGASPWAEVWLERGTGALGVGTELLRKSLYDSAGGGITDTTTVVAGAIQ